MNQVETPAHGSRELFSTESVSNVVLPPPAPSSMARAVKQHDRPEVDHEDDQQQEQDSDRADDDTDYSSNQRGFYVLPDTCEPMVNYDGFESVGKPSGISGLPRFGLTDDDDVVNVCSPILRKSIARSTTLSPTCVSALAREEVVESNDASNEPSWTIEEFQAYIHMLELLQDTCSNFEGEEMCLSADSLGQMERLLTSLLPQGA